MFERYFHHVVEGQPPTHATAPASNEATTRRFIVERESPICADSVQSSVFTARAAQGVARLAFDEELLGVR
jgi:hypothetical protein